MTRQTRRIVILSKEDAHACLEAAAVELKEMSYQELERFAISEGMFDTWQSREWRFRGEKLEVNTMIGKLGRIHKRMCVELTLSAEDETLLPYTPCLYFERYESGRLDEPEVTSWEIALFLGGGVISLLALVWFLFLGSG